MPIQQEVKKDTKAAIMDAAEIVMAEHGVDGATVRAIVGMAGANTAAIHYHFNSREGLVEAMLRRHGGFVILRRHEMIAEFDRTGNAPTPIDVVNLLVDPRIEFLKEKGEAGRRATRFLARLQFDRSNQSDGKGLHIHVARKHFPEVGVRMLELIGQACPEVSNEELQQRLTMAIDTMFQYLANAEFMTIKWTADEQRGEMLRHTANLKTFLVGGLAAPATKQQDQTEMLNE